MQIVDNLHYMECKTEAPSYAIMAKFKWGSHVGLLFIVVAIVLLQEKLREWTDFIYAIYSALDHLSNAFVKDRNVNELVKVIDNH